MAVQGYVGAVRSPDYLRIFTILAVANVLVTYFVYVLTPSARPYLVEEDMVIETLSALLFLTAFFIGLPWVLALAPWRGHHHDRRYGYGYGALITATILGLIGFLDELSFGGRMVEIDYVRIYGHNLDAVHDLFYFAAKSVQVLGEAFGFAVYVVAVFVALFAVWFVLFKHFGRVWQLFHVVRGYAPFTILFCAFGLIIAALIIDLHIIRWEPLTLLEELLEMNAAWAMIFCVLSAVTSVRRAHN